MPPTNLNNNNNNAPTTTTYDDDESSTAQEMQKLWDKLDRMQADGRLKLQKQKATKTFECPLSSSDSSLSCDMNDDGCLQSSRPVRNEDKKSSSNTSTHDVNFSPVSDTPKISEMKSHDAPFRSLPSKPSVKSRQQETFQRMSGDNGNRDTGLLDTTASDGMYGQETDSSRLDTPVASIGSSQKEETTRNDVGSCHMTPRSSAELRVKAKPKEILQRVSDDNGNKNARCLYTPVPDVTSVQEMESYRLETPVPSVESPRNVELLCRKQATSSGQNGVPLVILTAPDKNNIAGNDEEQKIEKPTALGNDEGDIGDSSSSSSTDDSSSSDSTSSSSTSSSTTSTSSFDTNPVEQDTRTAKITETAGTSVQSPACMPRVCTNNSVQIRNPYLKNQNQNKSDHPGVSDELSVKTSTTEGRTPSQVQKNKEVRTSRYFQKPNEAIRDQRPPDEAAAESLTSKLSHQHTPPVPREFLGTQHTEERSMDREEPPNSLPHASEDNIIKRTSWHRPIQEYNAPNEVEPEIDSALYTPPEVRDRLPPVLHNFNLNNCPPSSRRHIPVRDLFQSPISNLWSTKIERFNALQSAVSNTVCHSDDHVVVSAPTGAGKTAIFEMAMARFFVVDLCGQSTNSNGHKQVSKKRKIVYIAPSKALCEERYEDWSRRLAFINAGIQLVMITGDVEPGSCYKDFADSHVILSTPEKWDSISRRWSEKFFLMASVKLFMIDEVHLLGDDSRGHSLESIVSRMKSIQRAARAIRVSKNEINSSSYPNADSESIGACMRVVAVSATLPNIAEVAEFIGANEACAFDESFRPVPLARHVVGLGYVGKNEYRFWSTLDKHVPELINKFSRGKQTLVFCHTKKETESLVGVLVQAGIGPNRMNSHTSRSAPGTVQFCLDSGIAYHHAGMEKTDRKRIEQAFLDGQLKCLCATSTLAVGVNLPAHLVIVKGTRTWRGGGNGYQEIDRSSLLQMIGRAGRPGLDTSGTAVIMTDCKSKKSIEQLMQGLGPAQSYLLPKLLDVLNIEISQRVVGDIESAINWLKTTFLYCRLKDDPEKYGLEPSVSLDSYLHSLCHDTISQLRDTGLISWSDDGVISPRPACHIMSQNMMSFGAMKRITELSSDTTQAQLLTALCEMDELHYPVRRLEKKILNECHKEEVIRFKLGPLSKVRIQRPSEKAFVLLQAYIGQHNFPTFTLGQEMTTVADNAQRILSAAQEYCIRGSQNGRVALLCLKLKRSLHFCLWGESSGVLNQIPNVGQKATEKLNFAGIRTFAHVVSAKEAEIERAAGLSAPFGSRLKSAVSAVLKEKLKIRAEIEYTRSNLAAGVSCTLEPVEPAVAALTGTEKATVTYSILAYTDRPGTSVFFEDKIRGGGCFTFSCPQKFGKLSIHLLSSMIGIDETLVLDGNDVCMDPELANPTQKRPRIRNTYESTTRSTTSPKNNSSSNSNCVAHSNAQPQKQSNRPLRSPQQARVQNEGNREQGSTDRMITITPQKSGSKCPTRCVNGTIPMLFERAVANSNRARERRIGVQENIASKPTHFRTDMRAPEVSNISPIPTMQRDRMLPLVTPQCHPPPSIDHSQGWTTSPNAGSTPSHLREPRTFTTNSINRYQGQSRSPNVGSNVRNTQESHTSTKKDMNTGAWRQAKRKQERSQQRAFPSKKDNPFAFFKHDPNDAESFLEGLSSQRSTKSSIIPDRELEQLERSTVSRVPRFKRSMTAKGGKKTPNTKRRRYTSPLQRVSNEQLLRMKAAEQQGFSTVTEEENFPFITNSPDTRPPHVQQVFTSQHTQDFSGTSSDTWGHPISQTGGTFLEQGYYPQQENSNIVSQSQQPYMFEPQHDFSADQYGYPGGECFAGPENQSMQGYDGVSGWDNVTFQPHSQAHSIAPPPYDASSRVMAAMPSPRLTTVPALGFHANHACSEENNYYSTLIHGQHSEDPAFDEAFFHQN